MFLIKNIIKDCGLKGLGVFADQDIPKGTIVWKFDPKFEVLFDQDEIENMPDVPKNLVKTYAYLSPVLNKYVFSIDNSRFVNHSVNCNVDSDILLPDSNEVVDVANKDIKMGEEITCNYRVINQNDAVSNEEYLNS